MSPWSEVKRTIVSSARPEVVERLQQPADLLVDGRDRRVIGRDLLAARARRPLDPVGPHRQLRRVVELHELFAGRRRGRAAAPSTTTRKNGSSPTSFRNSIARSVQTSGSNRSSVIGRSVSRK